MKTIQFILPLLFLAFTQCQKQKSTSGGSIEQLQSNSVPGELKEISCSELDITSSLLDRSSCYRFSVPESRDGNSANVIELPIVRIKSVAQNADPDPVFFLNGGPGLPSIQEHTLKVVTALDFNRDIILMDQRGTGLSKPSLACSDLGDGPQDDDADADDTDSNQGDSKKGNGDARADNHRDGDDNPKEISECYKKIKAKGIRLSNYNTRENAADFADLVQALNLDKANYYGLSYGTRLGLEILRNHSEHVRSVVLDGVLPPHIYPLSQTIQGLWEILVRMAKDCTENTQCNQKYADTSNSLDFSGTFQALLSRVDSSPIQHNGKSMNKKDIITFLSEHIYSRNYHRLPYIIKKIYDKDFSVLGSDANKQSGGDPVDAAIKYADTSNSLDFSGTFQALLSRVDSSPIQHNGKSMNKKDIITFLSEHIYSRNYHRLPYIIKKIYDKDFSVLGSDANKQSGGDPVDAAINMAMGFSVVCHDEFPFESESRVQAEEAKFHIKETSFMSKKALCTQHWVLDKKGTHKIKEAVKSDLPVLLLSGAYDSRTPEF